ncbi:DnaJ-domain-containing protein [Trematosphaeria pertusa]|uniref:DnaJ-domain-containing protein n=1 Tax=Trematosphaeria pertusa TaxID=390896 RepID=A0A6A6IW97_9PLEO|nr:DnaJ-domain-containing protein [Trematosphaeria pertusa]KAF2254558.1 DnaJ-domain-containing protein [Trematosphaeria pertusa]
MAIQAEHAISSACKPFLILELPTESSYTIPMANHYETLGVTHSATADEIKAAFKKLALENHPDKTQHLTINERASREEFFKAVLNAYEVLSDAARRAAHDTHLGPRGVHTPSQCEPNMQRTGRAQPAAPPSQGRSTRSDPRSPPLCSPFQEAQPRTPPGPKWQEDISIPGSKFTTIGKKREAYSVRGLRGLVVTHNLRRVNPRGVYANLGHPIHVTIRNAPGKIERISVYFKEIGDDITLSINIRVTNNSNEPQDSNWNVEFDLNAVEDMSTNYSYTNALAMALEIYDTDALGKGRQGKSYDPRAEIRRDHDFAEGDSFIPSSKWHTPNTSIGLRSFIIKSAVTWLRGPNSGPVKRRP